jgi:hypothetical protein
VTTAVATVLGLSLFGVAYAARGAKANEPIDLAELQRLCAESQSAPDFPLVANPKVLARVNHFVEEPGRAAWFKKALERMQPHKRMLDSHIAFYGHPSDLLAVPIVESGYENLPQIEKRTPSGGPYGAGMWMFIKQTARHYGLRVNDQVDERLDVEKETDAAMRLLAANRLRFKDWHLSLAAYNEGEGKVQRAIEQGGTRDAWELVNSGRLNDYLVDVTAAVILMRHPELLD